MINVSLNINHSKRYLRLRVRGHAGQDVRGKDIVCASASLLAYTVAQIIKDMGETNKLSQEPYIILKDGLATVTCVCKDDEAYAKAYEVYQFAQTGFLLLAHNYPQYVEISTVGKAD